MIPETQREIEYRYGDTYVRTTDGAVVMVLPEQPYESGEVECLDSDDTVVYDYNDIIWEYPSLGFVKYDYTIMYTSRDNRTRYKRGLRMDDITTKLLTRESVAYFDSKFLRSVMFPKYDVFNSSMESGILSCDVALHTSNEVTTIYYKLIPVGVLINGVAVLDPAYGYTADELELLGVTCLR